MSTLYDINLKNESQLELKNANILLQNASQGALETKDNVFITGEMRNTARKMNESMDSLHEVKEKMEPHVNVHDDDSVQHLDLSVIDDPQGAP